MEYVMGRKQKRGSLPGSNLFGVDFPMFCDSLPWKLVNCLSSDTVFFLNLDHILVIFVSDFWLFFFQAFEDLLCDLDIWARAPDEQHRMLYEHFYELITE